MDNFSGKLDIIIGCMFSGKTTQLLNRINKALVIYDNVLIVNHSADKRYVDDSICSHDKQYIHAVTCKFLSELFEKEEYMNTQVIFIDEGQFFQDLQEFAIIAVEQDNKWVTVCGLDGDSERKPFGQLLDIIPIADSIIKTTALCKYCKDGTPALFSAFISGNTKVEQMNVGGADKYVPLCRKHYLQTVM